MWHVMPIFKFALVLFSYGFFLLGFFILWFLCVCSCVCMSVFACVFRKTGVAKETVMPFVRHSTLFVIISAVYQYCEDWHLCILVYGLFFFIIITSLRFWIQISAELVQHRRAPSGSWSLFGVRFGQALLRLSQEKHKSGELYRYTIFCPDLLLQRPGNRGPQLHLEEFQWSGDNQPWVSQFAIRASKVLESISL